MPTRQLKDFSMLKELLQSTQPVVYQALYNALASKTVSHAYLFSGPFGTPKKEAAQLLAMSLFCHHSSPFACESCSVCQRVLSENHLDYTVLDGSVKSISKKDVDDLQHSFSTTSAEADSEYRVCIILNIENSSVSAMNSLLKFLEEPAKNVVAVLTTDNVNRILPTIVSRCTTLPFTKMPAEYFYQAALSEGISADAAYFLARLVSEKDKISKTAESSAFKNAELMFQQTISGNFAELLIDYDISYRLSTKPENLEMMGMFLKLLDLYAHDIITKTSDGPQWYRKALQNAKGTAMDYARLIILVHEQQEKCNKYNDLSLLMAETYERLEEFRNELKRKTR